MNGISNPSLRIRTALVVVGIMALLAGPTMAADVWWVGGEGTFNWSDPANWSGGVAPTDGQKIDIMQDTAGNIDINYDASSLVWGNYWSNVGNTGGGTTTINLGPGKTLIGDSALQLMPGGRLHITGGTLQNQNGQCAGGTIDMSAGSITSSDDFAAGGGGTWNISGGTFTANRNMWGGHWYPDKPWNLNITGTATVNVYGTLSASGYCWGSWYNNGTTIGGNTNILQDGGTLSVGTAYMYPGTNWELRSGSMNYGQIYIEGGNFRQTGGEIQMDWGIFIYPSKVDGNGLAHPEMTAKYTLTGGTKTRARCIFVNGDGTFEQGDGTTVLTDGNSGFAGVKLGADNTTTATYLMHGGTANLFGNMQGVIIYPKGVFRGNGTVNAYPGMYVTGKIIADGEGAQKDLKFNSAWFYNTTNLVGGGADEGNADGTAGWYAVNKGRVVMPTTGYIGDYGQWNLAVTPGYGTTYNIGETPYSMGDDSRSAAPDTTIDLVNSAQVDFTTGMGGTGFLNGSLLATDRNDIAAHPGMNFISVHDISMTTGLWFTTASLTIRYDAVAAAANEGILKLYQFVDGAWVNTGATVDTTNKYITATGLTSLGEFAVGYSSFTPTSALTANPLTGAAFDFASNLPDRAKTLTNAVILANSGDAGTTLKITGVAITGANASNFAFNGAVNDVLPADPGQAFNVKFLGAHLPGTYTATLTVTTDAATDNVVSYTLSAVVARMIGDANMDNHVNFTDYLALEQTFNTAVTRDTGADFTKDGLVNFSDYLALEQNFNTSGAAVPEPMTLSLLGLGALALIRRRK